MKIILYSIILIGIIVGGAFVTHQPEFKERFIKKEIIEKVVATSTPSEIIKEDVQEKPIEKPVEKIEQAEITLYPKQILPGDPVFITVKATSTPTEVLLDGKKLSIITYNGLSHAVAAIPFEEKVLTHTIKTTLANGETITTPLTITPREKIERPLGIPEKLGGNTTEASKQLATNLAKENAVIINVPTDTKQLWNEVFTNPLSTIFITDDYGYDRKTVDRTIVHKGTDYRAATGTPVMAMNNGVVKVARPFIVYGNTIIIDHGKGIQTLYMHLSKLDVKEGDTVERGDTIGLSGMTGYADAAHLHISVKVGGVSIDPEVFMGFFRE